MDCRKQRRGSFLLEAAAVLLLLMAAAGSIAHFAATTTRSRQQQWTSFQREMQLDNAAERLQHATPAQREATADRLMDDERYGRPGIEIRTVDVDGVAGQHIVITPSTDDSPNAAKPLEFWRFDADAAEAESDDSDAGEEGDNDD